MRDRGAGRAVGIDLSPAMVSRMRRSPGVHLLAGSATALPFRDATFTRVLSVESLYYYGELDRALRELRRVCRDKARAVFVLDLYEDNAGSHGWVRVLEHSGVNVHLLSATQYQEKLTAAGFSHVHTDRLVDRRPTTPRNEFAASRWFPTYELYATFCESGSLLIDATA
jgi:ubiquinone/menaquinone biosynthesis C-methylase UbiE